MLPRPAKLAMAILLMTLSVPAGATDAETGQALTGYPDGQAAWLADEDTVRVAYQSESYGTMSNETYRWVMDSGAEFTGSHIHAVDYDRAGLAGGAATLQGGNDVVLTVDLDGTQRLHDPLPQRGVRKVVVESATVELHLTGAGIEADTGH